jgi:4-diphosphocytidyl-2-C-methyl-D-erythritol kinase
MEGLLGLAEWDDLPGLAHNDFEPVISAAHPEIRRAISALRRVGARVELMSGSGSTCFGLFERSADAAEAAKRLTGQLGWPCRAVRSLTAFPGPVPA